MAKRMLYCLLTLGLIFSIQIANADIVNVQIPSDQKRLELPLGASFKFDARVFDEQGYQVQAVLMWKVTDLNGFETALPGSIDDDGFFMSSRFFSRTL